MASVTPSHELYEDALAVLLTASENGSIVSTTLHTYAELYNHLTKPRRSGLHLPPDTAYQLIVEQLGRRLELVELTRADYEASLRRCAELDLVSAVVYYALHVQAAVKAKADVLYSDNLKDFSRLILPSDNLDLKGIRR